jgi:hypothetical protein
MRSKTNLAILICLILLSAVSISNFLHFYSTFIPRYFDQSVTVLEFYDAYYFWKDGASPFFDFIGALLKLQTLKGGLTQDVGLVLSILLGPNRLSLWLPNFGALLLFLAVVYKYASRTMSKEAALIIATTTLLGPAVYMPAGGLYDLRWDFVGIMMFGCFLFSFWKLINQNTKTNMAIAILFALIAIDVRSTNMVYVGLTISGVALVFLLLLTSKSIRSYALAQFKTMVILGTIVLMFYAVFGIIHWADINSYYLDRTLPGRPLAGEQLVRIKESGAEDGILMFYIQSTFRMYKPFVVYPLLVLAALWAYWWISSRRSLHPSSPSVTTGFVVGVFRWRIEGAVIAIVASISVLVPASLYAPGGIPPAYLLGACSILLVCSTPTLKQNGGRVLLWLILIALFSFALVRIGSMQGWSKSELKKQNNALQLFQSVLSNKQEGGRIFFSVVDEALLPETFMIWLYENGNRMIKEKFTTTSLDILPLSSMEYVTQFSESDIIFRWDKAPSKTTYPSEEQAIGVFVSNLWARYSSQFVLLKDVPYKDGVVGVYARRIHAADIYIPLWIEKEGIFWLGDEHARISIVNGTATVLPAKISATLSLGPSVPKGSQVKLCVVPGDSASNCYPVSSNIYDFEIVAPVDPGTNEVELSVVHDDGMIFLPINDSRRLLLKVSNLRISEVGQ